MHNDADCDGILTAEDCDDGDETMYSSALDINCDGLLDVGGVFAGRSHTCGMDVDGGVQCWGQNNYGQVSDAPSGTFVQVSAGYYHNCGIDSSGSIECWGGDNYDQSSPPTGTFAQVSTGRTHSCAIDMVGSVQCWGGSSSYLTTLPSDFQAWNGAQ